MSSRPSASACCCRLIRVSATKPEDAVFMAGTTITDLRIRNQILRIEKKHKLSEDGRMASPALQNDRDALPAHLRREQIRRLVDERGFVRVTELRDAFGVSGVTARADLDVLVGEGAVQRVHGGAVPAQAGAGSGRPERESSFEEALASSVVPKQQIGELAASLVRSGQSVILDVGTTTLAIARALRELSL